MIDQTQLERLLRHLYSTLPVQGVPDFLDLVDYLGGLGWHMTPIRQYLTAPVPPSAAQAAAPQAAAFPFDPELLAVGADEPPPIAKAYITHILHQGGVLCKDSLLRSRPVDWPEGHQWVGRADAQHADCVHCQDALGRLLDEENGIT